MRTILVGGVAFAILALSACSDKGADADGDGKVSQAEAQKELSKGGAVAMKPGLWEVKIKFDSIEAPGMPEAAKAQMTCKPEGGITVASKMDGSFEGDSYIMNMEQKTIGTPMGEMKMKGRIEGKRIGDCPA